jgi:enoyl-CoA hydratase
VNALDIELLAELTEALHDAASSTRALVLTGAGHVFCAGVDLRRVLEGEPGYTDRLIPALSEAFEALFRFPAPMVAAIKGGAVAGGCGLACACDRRLITPDAVIGATEVRVGVPLPAAALEILRFACGDLADEVMLGGQLHRGNDALTRRLAHAVVEGDIVEDAVGLAADLATLPADAYRNTKAQLYAPALARIHAGAEIDDEVRRIWASSQTMTAIRGHMDVCATTD